MPELISSKFVKARKRHYCGCCSAVAAKPGDMYERRTYVFDDRIYDWVTCAACDVLTAVVYNWAYQPDEGVGDDTFTDWANESADDPQHGEAAKAYLARRSEAMAGR